MKNNYCSYDLLFSSFSFLENQRQERRDAGYYVGATYHEYPSSVASLSIDGLTLADSGLYECEAKWDAEDVASKSIFIKVLSAGKNSLVLVIVCYSS